MRYKYVGQIGKRIYEGFEEDAKDYRNNSSSYFNSNDWFAGITEIFSRQAK